MHIRLFIIPGLAALLLGCACASTPGGHSPCLDEVGVQDIQNAFLADPQAAEQDIGEELCLDGIVTFVESKENSATVSVVFADQVGVLFRHDKSLEPENYRRLAEWAEQYGEGDIIRVFCRLTEFVRVEGAPEPMVVPTFNDCSLAE